MAAGALRAIYEAGLRVPDDIAVFGFDGLQHQMLRHPNLSTVVQSAANLGMTAVRLLLDRINEPESPAQHVYLSSRLERRGSCGCTRQSNGIEEQTARAGVAAGALVTVSDAP
jgi:LacI family transcriptional regulator